MLSKGLGLLVLVFIAGCQKSDFTAIDGRLVNLKDDQGRWLILNVWADWCVPCREEIPELNCLGQRGDVRVVGHDFDNAQGEVLQKKIKRLKIDFPIVEESPLPAIAAKTPNMLPATYIVNPEGKLVDTLYGPQTNSSIRQHLKTLQKRVADNG